MAAQTTETAGPFPPLGNLQRLAISESGFLFDPVSGHTFTVNQTALDILRLSQKSTDLQSILHHLVGKYDVSEQQAERDVLEFAAILRSYIGEH